MCGIYELQNTRNGKRYIGRSVNILNRCLNHKYHLDKGDHKNPHLQAAWDFHGAEAFEFNLLESVGEAVLPQREGFYCALHQVYDRDKGYNVDLVDEKGATRFSEAHKAHLSQALMGHAVSENSRALFIERLKEPKSEEARQKMSASQTGRRHSPETIEKMREAGRKREHKPLSQETKDKLSAAHKGFQHTSESKAKMSAAQKGKAVSEDSRKKMSEAQKGKTRSQESIEKGASKLRGKPRSQEASQKAALSNKGRKRTEEARARISQGIQGARARKLQEAAAPLVVIPGPSPRQEVNPA